MFFFLFTTCLWWRVTGNDFLTVGSLWFFHARLLRSDFLLCKPIEPMLGQSSASRNHKVSQNSWETSKHQFLNPWILMPTKQLTILCLCTPKKDSSMPSTSSCRGCRILWFFFGQLLEFNLQVFTLHLKRENRCPGFSAATNLSSPVQSFSSLPIHQAVQPTPASGMSGFKWLIFWKNTRSLTSIDQVVHVIYACVYIYIYTYCRQVVLNESSQEPPFRKSFANLSPPFAVP